MNKKKFLATCTLVAFGSTMLPAFAFAAKGDLTPTTVTPTTTTIAIEVDSWLNAGDTMELKALTEGVVVPEYTASVNSKNAEFKLNSALPMGSYQLVISDTSNSGTADPGSPLVKNFEVKNATAEQATSLTKVDAKGNAVNADGAPLTGANLGLVKIASTLAATEGIYELSDVNGTIAAKTTPVAMGVGSANIDATKLQADKYYGTATKTTVDGATVASVPTAIFTISQAEYDKMTDAKKAEMAKVQAKLDAIPSSVTVAAGGASTNVLATIIALINDTDVLKSGEAAVIGVTGNTLKAVMDETAIAAAYDADTDVVTGADATGAIALDGLTSASGTVKIAVPVPNAAVAGMYVVKTVNVTVGVAPAVTAVRDTYGAANFADYDKAAQKATATFTKVGEGFDFDSKMTALDGTVKTVNYQIKNGAAGIAGASAYDVKEVFDAKTGKVIALPAEDMTLTAVLEMVDADGGAIAAGDEITVTFTIKAAGQTGDLEQLEKEYRAAETVVLDKIAELSTAEGKLTVAQLNELYKAYKPYKEAKAAYNAAKGE